MSTKQQVLDAVAAEKAEVAAAIAALSPGGTLPLGTLVRDGPSTPE